MARRSWSSLTAKYRGRLLASGRSGRLTGQPLTAAETEAYYATGGDLRRGRGHPARPKGALNRDLTERLSYGRALTKGEQRDVAAWRRSRSFPSWIPRSRSQMGDDTAAILSQVPYRPSNWRAVTATRIGKTGAFMVTITPKVGYPYTFELPDYDSLQELGRLLNDYSRVQMASTKAERKRLERDQWRRRHRRTRGIRVDITGS